MFKQVSDNNSVGKVSRCLNREEKQMVTQRDIDKIKGQLEEIDDIKVAYDLFRILKRTIGRLLLVSKVKN